MEVIAHHFCNPLADYKNFYPLQGRMKIKKMITASMFRWQVWMDVDEEFEHIVENSQRILKLNDQYENHPYVDEFTKENSSSMLYTMIVKSLKHCWDSFEQNPKMLNVNVSPGT